MTIVITGSGVARPTEQSAVPTTGQTVVIAESSGDIDLWIVPATSLAALTVQLPVGFDGQNVNIGSSKAITILTITGSTNVFNAANTLQAGDSFTLKRFSANNWSHP